MAALNMDLTNRWHTRARHALLGFPQSEEKINMTDPYLKPVRLRTDRYRGEGVQAGAIGVVVENWGDGWYEVEFSNPNTGETIALLTLPAEDFEVISRRDMASVASGG
jgi:hypothetical protein